MAAPSSGKDTQWAYGPTANGDYMELPFQPSMGGFSDTLHRAFTNDDNPNNYVPLPTDWKLSLPSDDKGGSQLPLAVSKEDANSFRSCYDPPKF